MQPTHPEPRAGLPLISANALNQTDANKAVPVAAPLGGYGVRRPTPGEMEKNQIVRKAEQELSQSPCNTVADLLQANGRDVAMCLLPLMTKTMPRHCAIDEADGVRFTTFSFAEKPTQSIQVSAPFDLSNGNRPPFADIRKGAVEAGAQWVKVAKMNISSTRLYTDSLLSCTAVAAFYKSGEMLLYHSNGFVPDDLDGIASGAFDKKRKELLLDLPDLPGTPTDLLVIAKHQAHPGQQAVIKHVLKKANALNLHIVCLEHQGSLAVNMTPGKIEVWKTSA